jgi:putative nucleotidyltransferase with HDIG domain
MNPHNGRLKIRLVFESKTSIESRPLSTDKLGMNSQKAKEDLIDLDMVPVQRREFTEGTMFAADIFLRRARDNYILMARQGQRANLEQLHVVENDSLEYLYVRREDYKNCVAQNIMIAELLLKKEEISSKQKTHFVSRAIEGVFKEIEHSGANHESIEHARLVAANIRTLVEAKPDLTHVVETLASVPGDLLRHSLAVSTFSIMIAAKLGWTLQPTLEKLAMGALLHDIGLKEIPKEILNKPRHELSYDERVIYESHAFRGAEILRSMPSINDDIISMVYEHHENAIGQGYPRRLRDFRMNPHAKIIALADAFCDLTFGDENTPLPKTPDAALQFIQITLGQPFNKPAFNALKEVLNRKKESGAA